MTYFETLLARQTAMAAEPWLYTDAQIDELCNLIVEWCEQFRNPSLTDPENDIEFAAMDVFIDPQFDPKEV